MDLSRLEENRDEILKAELASLIALWDKISPLKINKANIGISYNNLSCWENEIKTINIGLLDRNFNLWDDFLNDWRSWRNQNELNKILQIFYGIGESLNSGIDKGSPKEDIKVQPTESRRLSNAFGGFRTKIFYLRNEDANLFVESIKNNILTCFSGLEWENTKEAKRKLKAFLSNLLSDDRFPINDVTLWDQTYMATTMFKATLSSYILTHDSFNEIPNRQDVKWRILGIQYDKLGLAEKGLKIATITWYREATKRIDDRIKELLEVKYPIGNELYRDETGIYFLVGESLGEDLNDGTNLAVLKEELEKIEEKIYEIFEEELDDELYPAIFLTKSSRGLMNLGYLIKNAKENFLKSKIKKRNLNLYLSDSKGNAIGVCPVCRTRLIYEKDKEKRNKPTICSVCDDRIHHKRVKEWVEDIKEETIWTGELQDKNGRIALITLKFELKDWLNGNLLNSLVNRIEDYSKYKNTVKNILKTIKNKFQSKDLNNLSISQNEENNFKYFFGLFDKKGIQYPYDSIYKNKLLKKILCQPENNLRDREKSLKDLFFRSLEILLHRYLDKLINKWVEFIENKFNVKCNFIESERRFKNQNIFDNSQILDFIKSSFSFGFISMQIQNILLERSIGDKWEEFIYKSLNDWDEKGNKPKKEKIDFDKRIIYWDNLEDEDMELLSTLILQFLLRKNPSPARLRRIWESTEEFVEDVKNNLIKDLEIPEWRKRRLVFKVDKSEINEELKETGEELDGNGLLFWAQPSGDKVKIYLISSSEEFIERFGKRSENKKGNEEILKNIYKSLEDEKENEFKNNIIDFEIKLEKEINGEKKSVATLKKDNLLEIQSYKPFASIIDPTPISWQFIIPAEYVPKLIETIQNKYYKNFKWVYGKLPLHVGVVIQKYDKPLYMGINALRRIRRDLSPNEIDELFSSENNLKKIEEVEEIFKKIIINEICSNKDANDKESYEKLKNHFKDKRLNEILSEISNKVIEIDRENFEIPDRLYDEIKNETEKYYALYWGNRNFQNPNSYIFYIKPKDDWKKELCSLTILNKDDKIICFPNTFDFEFLDTNNRRNDISYYNGKRILPLKSNRPYNLEDWEKFKTFKEIFKDKSSKVQKLVSVIYEHLEYWDENNNESIKQFLTSSFINILELNKKSNEDILKGLSVIFDIKSEHEHFKEKLKEKINQRSMLMFIDMFEFWHKGLKER